ncbi:exopolyphosphatase [Phlyctema vagabunda]|uniref:Exopolyphosphatase n=1 Tax=Phlyctema vagabunda TaxID=108571 RepID=A0ABR4PVL8_9HELO
MPPPRVSLRAFLSTAKAALTTAGQQASPVTLVIGNESADLDSLCSAVVLAYLRTYSATSKTNTLYIPLSNIPQEDLSLRPELLPVLSRANLKLTDLITLSDLPRNPSLVPGNTKWILVDHNSLQGELGLQYSSRVVGCVDHHDEENKVPRDTGEEPRIVKKSGSCSSLVVEYCKEAWNALSEEVKGKSETVSWNAELAYVALAPIVIDTTNLTSKSKTTSDDIAAVNYLENFITAHTTERGFDRDAYFDEVTKAKEDIGGLPLAGILRKDYKQWTESSMHLGVSSSVKDIQFLIEKAGGRERFLEAVRQFAQDRDLSICSIMTTSTIDGVFRRELFVAGFSENGIRAAKAFQRDYTDKLGLKTWDEGSLDLESPHEQNEWRRCWWQHEVANSRKQVAPLLRTAMQ